MKKNINLTLLSLTFSVIPSLFLSVNSEPLAVSSTYVCPDTSNGETEKDCPWASEAKKIEVEKTSEKEIINDLKRLLPGIKDHPWKDIWGRSINYDENAHGIIVNPAIIKALENIFQLSEKETSTIINDRQIVHAGMEHTYGYLFSNLKTPYGYKRERWVSGELEKGFNLPDGIFGPNPKDGSLFSNISYFMGHIAFRNNADRLKQLEADKNYSAKILQNFSYNKLKVTRLEELITLNNYGDKRNVILNTDFVEFPSPQKNSYLLVYSIYDSAKNNTHLISGFPVEKSFFERAVKAANLGNDLPIITRYNAYVDGITDIKGIKGEKRITDVTFLKY